MTIQKSDLFPGAIIEQKGERLKLIEHSPSWRADEMPYCNNDAFHDKQNVFSFQRWKVDIDGFITHRNIHYFVGIGHFSANCAGWFKSELDT